MFASRRALLTSSSTRALRERANQALGDHRKRLAHGAKLLLGHRTELLLLGGELRCADAGR